MAQMFTENVILRDPSTGLVAGFLAGDEAPVWARELTDHITKDDEPATEPDDVETETEPEPEPEVTAPKAPKTTRTRTTK